MSSDKTHSSKILKLINSRKMNFWLLQKLPMAFFLGVRVKHCDELMAETTMPFWWLSQNPFRSVYFAAQCSAAELATGVLVIAATENDKRISILLVGIESVYTKKATSRITFRCEDGMLIRETVQKAIESGKGETVTATSIGYDQQGDVVSNTKLTWSFKVRSSKR